ncbi:flagellar export chaperone FlgN [Desulfofundulus thermosubterraneus]|uniref:FlgN protein n=1 Tax=Desulfofundulus thermosubterraneus DSM 16057 TaxID=1121432 RepID=A0A1M6K426_9FIRM|nr:flagellar export chaperone FlgN [Desulfofundulus thermosubterraneus]SHJ53697.1 FlgN protein [Desulfofundulus thermosubterraneus DSM 16057]
MQELIEELVSILKEELAALEKMAAAAEKQNAALRKNSGDSLNEATRELEFLARHMEELKATRTRVQEYVRRACGLFPGAPLAELVAAMPPVLGRQEAMNLVADLRGKARELAELVRLNNLLAQNALRFCERLLKAIAPTPAKTYLPDGAMDKGSTGPSFVDKSV